MAYCKTHYYGGIKKYQWTTIPLGPPREWWCAGTAPWCRCAFGEAPGDPQFTVGDLLPHLAGDRQRRPWGPSSPAEQLNLFVGSRPLAPKRGVTG